MLTQYSYKLTVLFVLILLYTIVPIQCQQPNVASVTPPNNNKPIYTTGLTFQLEPREESCYYEELPVDSVLHVEYEVIRGGLLDITFKLYDPYNQVVKEKLSFFNRVDDNANNADGIIDYTARIAGMYHHITMHETTIISNIVT